jgi:uncharacterized SAM-binding protein YcdF (DUF218 family)
MVTHRRRLRGRLLLAGLSGAAVLGLLWAAGFAWFLRSALMQTEIPPAADGIVVLTGGAGRVEAALHLLADGRARVLLVSGVGGAADFADLAHLARVDPHLGSRVTLGREAASTRGNAAETADWARSNAIRSLIVVTAGYHMPRALTELGRALPEVVLYPAPVLPPALRGGAQAAVLPMLVGEYSKFLAAEIGLTALDLRPWRRADGRAGLDTPGDRGG